MAEPSLGPELDAIRARVATEGLTAAAVGALTPVVRGLPLEALTPVKQLLKRFFSNAPWTAADDDALADVVGAGSGEERYELAPDLVLVWGWRDDRFRVRLAGDRPAHATGDAAPDLGRLFDGAVVPEATPSPRTIRFATPSLGDGPSRAFDAAHASDDPRVARVFAASSEVTNVLVGPTFVAVTVRHADRWETLLPPLLAAVTEAFAGEDTLANAPAAPAVRTLGVGGPVGDASEPRRLDRAWTELGALRPDHGEGLDRIVAATQDPEAARRQVAATLLADAPPEAAARHWARLLDDPSRSVRRAVVDVLGDAGRAELRPLLERALADADAWTRWRALRGLAALGAEPSRAAVTAVAGDPDFRVRLEATRVLRGAGAAT